MKILIPPLRPLIWVGPSKKDYMRFPDGVRDRLGYAPYLAQAGESAPGEKPLSRGILKGLGIRELVGDGQGDTYRVVYTVKLRAGIYVLHAFQKSPGAGSGRRSMRSRSSARALRRRSGSTTHRPRSDTHIHPLEIP